MTPRLPRSVVPAGVLLVALFTRTHVEELAQVVQAHADLTCAGGLLLLATMVLGRG